MSNYLIRVEDILKRLCCLSRWKQRDSALYLQSTLVSTRNDNFLSNA